MTALEPGLLDALRNLSARAAGQEVDWINIADARALTELGFASRTRQGWSITPAGEQRLAAEQPSAAPTMRLVRDLEPGSEDQQEHP